MARRTHYFYNTNLYVDHCTYKAVQVWESAPSHLKSLTEPAFRKQYRSDISSFQSVIVDVTVCPLFIVRGRVNERPGQAMLQ